MQLTIDWLKVKRTPSQIIRLHRGIWQATNIWTSLYANQNSDSLSCLVVRWCWLAITFHSIIKSYSILMYLDGIPYTSSPWDTVGAPVPGTYRWICLVREQRYPRWPFQYVHDWQSYRILPVSPSNQQTIDVSPSEQLGGLVLDTLRCTFFWGFHHCERHTSGEVGLASKQLPTGHEKPMSGCIEIPFSRPRVADWFQSIMEIYVIFHSYVMLVSHDGNSHHRMMVFYGYGHLFMVIDVNFHRTSRDTEKHREPSFYRKFH